MKLSENIKLEIKLHWFWFRSLWQGAVVVVLGYSLPMFDSHPLWIKIALGLLCAVGHYCWWRQGLSPDKKTFTPRIWK